MAAQLPAVPVRASLGRVVAGLVWLSEDWRNWLQTLKDRIDATAQRIGAGVALTAQAAAVSGTVSTPTLEAGLYRVSWVARITQAATTSSSVTVSIGATSGGVPTTQAGPALTSNVVGAVQSGSVVVDVDAATPITYATSYASVGGTPMQYALSVAVERLG
jgi:hypothetical protein